MYFIYTVEYYSAIKIMDIMNFAGQWTELENIILSVVSQSPKRHAWYVLTDEQILAKKYKMLMIHPTVPKKLNKKEGPSKNASIPLRRGTK